MEQLSDSPHPETTLRIVRVVAPVAATVMAAVAVVGMLTAPQGATAELLANVWGRATIIDLYLSLGAVWIWIIWRERSVAAAVLSAVLLVTTGSVALWGYISWRASSSRDMAELLLGRTEIGA